LKVLSCFIRKRPLILLYLFGTRVVWAQTTIFPAEPCFKNAGELQLVSRILEEFQYPAIQTKIVQHFGGFFHQIKVRQPIRRKDSIQTVMPSRRLDSFLYKAAQNFEVFQKSKTYSCWCSFQGLSNGTTLMQIQSGRTVTLTLNSLQQFTKYLWVTSSLSPNLDALSERNYDATLERMKEARNLFIFLQYKFSRVVLYE
jgi:hypothetical protein